MFSTPIEPEREYCLLLCRYHFAVRDLSLSHGVSWEAIEGMR